MVVCAMLVDRTVRQFLSILKLFLLCLTVKVSSRAGGNPATRPTTRRFTPATCLRLVLRSSLGRSRKPISAKPEAPLSEEKLAPLVCYYFHFDWQLNWQIANNHYGTYDHPTSLGDCSIFRVIFATIPESVGSGQRTNSVVVPSWFMLFSYGVPLYSQGRVPPNCKTRTMLLTLSSSQGQIFPVFSGYWNVSPIL